MNTYLSSSLQFLIKSIGPVVAPKAAETAMSVKEIILPMVLVPIANKLLDTAYDLLFKKRRPLHVKLAENNARLEAVNKVSSSQLQSVHEARVNIEETSNKIVDKTQAIEKQKELQKQVLTELIERAKAIDFNSLQQDLDQLHKKIQEYGISLRQRSVIINELKSAQNELQSAKEKLIHAKASIQTLFDTIESLSALILELGEEEQRAIFNFLGNAKTQLKAFQPEILIVS